MSYFNETPSTPADSRAQAELRSQYRPIGIGAVAAALTAAGKPDETGAKTPANSNERIEPRTSIAA
jgi:hypothetical protein